MPNRTRLKPFAAGIAAGTIGLATWVSTMASAPRFSEGDTENLGRPDIYYWFLLGVAVIGGLVVPRRAKLIGLVLGLPGLILSPWTTPRGDNDGLWVLEIPALAIIVVVLIAAASVAGWARTRLWGDG
jgi:hypothetical protein